MKKTICIIFFLFLSSVFYLPSGASGNEPGILLNDSVKAGIDYLLSFSDPDTHQSFDTSRVVDFLDFFMKKKPDENVVLSKLIGATPAYHGFDIKTPLSRLIRYTYNPNIPSFLTTPATVRISHWKNGDHPYPDLSRLSGPNEAPNTPFVTRGIEFTENAPDPVSGTYHAYDSYRTLIYFHHRGKNLLISLTLQKEKSDVGKKGAVIGPPEEWNHFFSGRPGVNRFGLGWVKSYIFKSFSIAVYAETDPSKPNLRCSIFKWLNAGWAGLNMVKPDHIRKGLYRFSNALKAILECKHFPEPSSLEKTMESIALIPEKTLIQTGARYFDSLKEKYGGVKAVSGKRLAVLIEDGDFLKDMDPPKYRAILVREYLKSFQNKPLMLSREDWPAILQKK